MTTKITAIAATAAIALTAAAPAMAKGDAATGKYKVTEQAYVQKQAGKIFDGTLFKNETFKVERFSKSGKYAYGMAYGHVNRHAWIATSALKKVK